MKLSTLFSRGVVTAKPDATLANIARKMLTHKVGAVVIEERNRPVGILTDRDLAMALGAKGKSPQTPAIDVMSRHVLAIPDETDIFTATKYLRERKVRRLPLVDANDELVGMVTLDDLLQHLGSELYDLAHSIDEEMQPSLPAEPTRPAKKAPSKR